MAKRSQIQVSNPSKISATFCRRKMHMHSKDATFKLFFRTKKLKKLKKIPKNVTWLIETESLSKW